LSGIATVVAKTLVAPIDRAKILLQVQPLTPLPWYARYRTGLEALKSKRTIDRVYIADVEKEFQENRDSGHIGEEME